MNITIMNGTAVWQQDSKGNSTVVSVNATGAHEPASFRPIPCRPTRRDASVDLSGEPPKRNDFGQAI